MKHLRVKFGKMTGLKRRDKHGGGFVPAKEVKAGFLAAFAEIEAACNVKFSTTKGTHARTYHVKRKAGFTGRGGYNGREIYCNSWIGSTTESQRWSGADQVRRVVLHEIMAHYFRYGSHDRHHHSGDTRDISHANVSAKHLSVKEKAFLVKKFGARESETVRRMRQAAQILGKSYATQRERKAAIRKAMGVLDVEFCDNCRV